MDRIEIGLEKAYLGWDVPAHLYKEHGGWAASVPKDAKRIQDMVADELRCDMKKRKQPFFEEKNGLFYMMFAYEGWEVILGPLYIYGLDTIRPKEKAVSLTPEKAAACLSTVCYLISGEYWPEKELLEMDFSRENLQKKEEIRQFLEFSEEKERYGYEIEQQWEGLIEKGELKIQQADTGRAYRELYRVGIFSPKDEKKQMEYMMVSAIVLASRAAIRGGVSPQKAYRVSDLYLQRMASSRSFYEMQTVGLEAANTFNDMVREHLQEKAGNFYCEKIKDYVGKHLREKILIGDIAAHVGLNGSYMTHLFAREENISVKAYIIREKLKLAENLLKNTNENIVAISEYLSFNSQSYFTECFRKEYGITPTEYRGRFCNKN